MPRWGPLLAGIVAGALAVLGLSALVDEDPNAARAAVTADGGVEERQGVSPRYADPDGTPLASGDEPDGGGTVSVPSGGAGGTSSGGSGPQAAAGGASGTVRIGFLILRVGSLAPVGVSVAGVDPQQQRDFLNAYIDEHNEKGTFGGYTVEPVFRDFEVLTTDDHLAACSYLTEDQKVFAIVGLSGGFAPNAVLCITEQHETPLLYPGDTLPTEYVERSKGRLFSIFQHGNRAMFNIADQLKARGRLKDAVVGIVGDARSDPAKKTLDALAEGLDRAGTAPVHASHLAAEPNTAASQIPVQVSQMRSKGVNLVVLTTNSLNSTNFVQTAESQGWRPKYAVGDWSSMYTDTTAQNMPDAFDGSVAMTVTYTGDVRVNRPPPASNERCTEIYQRRTGRTMAPYGSNEWGLTVNGCGLVDILAAGMRAAGPDLTHQSLSDGLQRSGDVPVTQWRGGTYAPGKFDLSDYMRMNVWRASCTCWTPASEFVRTRY